MSDVARELFESSKGLTEISIPSNLFLQQTEESQNGLSALPESSTYTMSSGQSQMSRDVDLWLQGPAEAESNRIQDIRNPQTLRSTSANVPSFNTDGFWCIVALTLPFFNVNGYPYWRCSPSTILNTAELLAIQLTTLCDRLRSNIRGFAQNETLRDLFASAMDIILFVYAIGFLILSMYQASIIG